MFFYLYPGLSRPQAEKWRNIDRATRPAQDLIPYTLETPHIRPIFHTFRLFPRRAGAECRVPGAGKSKTPQRRVLMPLNTGLKRVRSTPAPRTPHPALGKESG